MGNYGFFRSKSWQLIVHWAIRQPMKEQILWQNPKISAITPVDLDATTSVTQTLTCNIGDITTAVDVKWKVKDGGDITNALEGYTITKGSVNQNNVQESTLTISPAQLQKLDTSSPVTYQCSAKSSQYPQSKESPYQNLVVTFHDFGEFIPWFSYKCKQWNSATLQKTQYKINVGNLLMISTIQHWLQSTAKHSKIQRLKYPVLQLVWRRNWTQWNGKSQIRVVK